MTNRVRRRAIRFIDTIAIALVCIALGRAAYVLTTPLTLETLTVGPVLVIAAGAYITATVLAILAFGAWLMVLTVFKRSSIRWRAFGAWLCGVALFVGISVATEVWINHHSTSTGISPTPGQSVASFASPPPR